MVAPPRHASNTSDPEVTILKAFATQLSPSESFERVPLGEATTTGVTPRDTICGPVPNRLVEASTPAPVPAATNCRRLSFLFIEDFIMLLSGISFYSQFAAAFVIV